MEIPTATPMPRWLPLAALACLTAASGCTSVISSAYLREAWLDAVEHAADAKSEAESRKSDRSKPGTGGDDAADESESRDDRQGGDFQGVVGSSEDAERNSASAATAWSPATLDEAVEEADRRLAQSGGLNAAGRGTLTAMLKSTPRQDWPVVVEEFAAALAAALVDDEAETAAIAAPAPPLPPAQSAPAQDTPPGLPAEPLTETPSSAAAVTPAVIATRPEPASPPLTIQNACFASRVRAWGAVDRFETAEFEPGQEVIVYFELEQLMSRESADGHTTRIDTVLRLVGGDGRRVHEWTFEPLEETCGSQRRDYFARYLVELPSATPSGPCRLELAVTDTIAGRTAHTTLPLSVVAR